MPPPLCLPCLLRILLDLCVAPSLNLEHICQCLEIFVVVTLREEYPPVHRAVLQQHVAYVEAEKPCSKEIFLATLLWSLCPTRHCPFATPHI